MIGVLAVGAMLALAGCKSTGLTGLNFCLDGCGGGGGYNTPFPMLTIVGFPRARVDSTGPLTPGGYVYGRLAVGDSVTLYMVKHMSDVDPCASTDTLRTVSWYPSDTAVFHARSRADGGGVLRAMKAGQSAVMASAGTDGTAASVYACGGSYGMYVGLFSVTAPAAGVSGK
jgi:hypothetical protein